MKYLAWDLSTVKSGPTFRIYEIDKEHSEGGEGWTIYLGKAVVKVGTPPYKDTNAHNSMFLELSSYRDWVFDSIIEAQRYIVKQYFETGYIT